MYTYIQMCLYANVCICLYIFICISMYTHTYSHRLNVCDPQNLCAETLTLNLAA